MPQDRPIFRFIVDLPRPSLRIVSRTLFVLLIVAAVLGAVAMLLRDSTPGEVEIVLPTSTAVADVKVYLTGAINEPGVYQVVEGARLAEAIEAAGGATQDADLTGVNLAARVLDEDHWHVPQLGEAAPAPTVRRTAVDSKLDINTASAEDLEELPQIGEVRARDIVEHRTANGPFVEVEGLLEVRGIGPRTLDTIRDLIEVR